MKTSTTSHYYCLCMHFIVARGGEAARRHFESLGYEPDELRKVYVKWRQCRRKRGQDINFDEFLMSVAPNHEDDMQFLETRRKEIALRTAN